MSRSILRPSSKSVLGSLALIGLVALLVMILATAAWAGVWLPGQQSSEPVEAPTALDALYRPSVATLPVDPYPLPKPKAKPTAAPVAAPAAPSGSVWDRLAACESGGDWSYNGGSGFDGGLQFLPSTWRMAGGTRYAPYAYQATREQQIAIAKAWLAETSWAQWPACSRRLGLR